jgi:hypothetical protein
MGNSFSKTTIAKEKRRLEYTVLNPKDPPTKAKPAISRITSVISTKVPEDISGTTLPNIRESPDIPPVVKLLGNLKKYIPAAARMVPKVIRR